MYHVSFSPCWIKNRALSHWLQAVRQSPATLSTRPCARSRPAPPQPPLTRLFSPPAAPLLEEGLQGAENPSLCCSTCFPQAGRCCLLVQKYTETGGHFSAASQDAWIRAVGLEMSTLEWGSWPWMNEAPHGNVPCKEHLSCPFSVGTPVGHGAQREGKV